MFSCSKTVQVKSSKVFPFGLEISVRISVFSPNWWYHKLQSWGRLPYPLIPQSWTLYLKVCILFYFLLNSVYLFPEQPFAIWNHWQVFIWLLDVFFQRLISSVLLKFLRKSQPIFKLCSYGQNGILFLSLFGVSGFSNTSGSNLELTNLIG